jgi:ELWxxDGT repeat protein
VGPPQLLGHFEESSPSDPVDVGGTLFFAGSDPAHGFGIWRSDGTAQGTVLVKDTKPGPDPPHTLANYCRYCLTRPSALTRIGRRLFFIGEDGVHGWEPWVSDGTEAGTRMVDDVNPGGASSMSRAFRFIDLQGTALFVADEPAFGRELWRSDGTAKGTRLVRDVGPGRGGPSGSDLFSFGDRAYFVADDGIHGDELWGSDGTEKGTLLLADMTPGPSSSSLLRPVRHRRTGLDYFVAYDQADPVLWRSDGTPRGTTAVVRLPGSGQVQEGEGTLLLEVSEPATGGELWASDGTAAGTGLLKDICPGPCPSYPTEFLRLGDAVLFDANDGQHGNELWRSDGTAKGTFLLHDIIAGAGSSLPYDFVRAGSLAYFIARDTELGHRSLWMTDGTTAGTRVVPGTEGKDPLRPIASGHSVYYITCSNAGPCDLWAVEVN